MGRLIVLATDGEQYAALPRETHLISTLDHMPLSDGPSLQAHFHKGWRCANANLITPQQRYHFDIEPDAEVKLDAAVLRSMCFCHYLATTTLLGFCPKN